MKAEIQELKDRLETVQQQNQKTSATFRVQQEQLKQQIDAEKEAGKTEILKLSATHADELRNLVT